MERRSGATGTGLSQKDLQLGKKRTKALEKLVEKVRAHCKLELGAVRSWKVTRAQLTDKLSSLQKHYCAIKIVTSTMRN